MIQKIIKAGNEAAPSQATGSGVVSVNEVWIKKSRETLCLITQKWLILESKLKLNVKTILQEL